MSLVIQIQRRNKHNYLI